MYLYHVCRRSINTPGPRTSPDGSWTCVKGCIYRHTYTERERDRQRERERERVFGSSRVIFQSSLAIRHQPVTYCLLKLYGMSLSGKEVQDAVLRKAKENLSKNLQTHVNPNLVDAYGCPPETVDSSQATYV